MVSKHLQSRNPLPIVATSTKNRFSSSTETKRTPRGRRRQPTTHSPSRFDTPRNSKPLLWRRQMERSRRTFDHHSRHGNPVVLHSDRESTHRVREPRHRKTRLATLTPSPLHRRTSRRRTLIRRGRRPPRHQKIQSCRHVPRPSLLKQMQAAGLATGQVESAFSSSQLQ